MNSKYLLISFSFLLSFNLFAETGNTSLQRRPGQIFCKEALKFCTYDVQNLPSARTLVSRLNAIVFPDDPLDGSRGILISEGHKRIRFWIFHDPANPDDPGLELLGRMKEIIVLLDSYENITTSSMVHLTTEVFAVSESGLTNLQMAFGLGNSPGTATSVPGGVSLNYAVGDFVLSASLAAGVTKNEVKKVSTVSLIVPNMGNIEFNHITNIYLAPTAGTVKEEWMGIKINGRTTIDADDRNLVQIKDFKLEYAVEAPRTNEVDLARFPRLTVPSKELNLYKGLNTFLVSSNTFETSRGHSIGLSPEFMRGNRTAKLVAFVRAKAFSFDELIGESRRMAKARVWKKFTTNQVANFPSNHISFEEVFASVKPYAYLTLSGDRNIGFKLDKALARKSNYNKEVSVKLSTKGFKEIKHYSIEELMLTGVRFGDLPGTTFRKNLVKFVIKFKPFKKFGKYTKKVTLFFNPETNRFIKR